MLTTAFDNDLGDLECHDKDGDEEEAWAGVDPMMMRTCPAIADKPEDRREAACVYIESVGGKLHGFWYALGEYDGYNVWEAPDSM